MEKPESYWREVYLNYAMTSGYKKRIEQARDNYRAMLDMGLRYQVNVSGGKDSLCLWHLANSIEPCVAVNYVDDMLDEHADVYANLKQVSEAHGMSIRYIRDELNIWALAEAAGKLTTDIRGEIERDDIRRMAESQKREGVECLVLGMRAEESKGRRINYALRGPLYFNKGFDYWVSQPLAHMKAKDVLAYLFEHQVSLPEVYFKTKFYNSPEMIRVDWLLPLESKDHIQYAWLAHYYPGIWDRLCRINPLFKTYVS